jgi:outer membrane protein assembly factor BamB
MIHVTTVLAASLAGMTLKAENWGQWRGPNFDGSTAAESLPLSWSTSENVRWKVALPGYSGATPVVWGDQVFVTTPDEGRNLLLWSIDRRTGEVQWKRQVVAGGDLEKGRNNAASPSPVTDGKRVVAMFATGDLAAYDLDGRELWRRNLAEEYGKFQFMWIYGSSPLLYDGKLYVQVLQHHPPAYDHAMDDKPTRDSYLLCLDPATGKNLWRHVRQTDAVSEAQEAYTTPIPVEGPNGVELVVVGGNYVTGHSPETGEEWWRCAGLNDRKEKYWRVVPSPVAVGGLVFACGPKRDPLLAIRPGGRGLVTSTHTAWTWREYPTDCVTPLAYRGRLFVLDGDRQMMTCLEPRTGRKIWQGNLGVRDIFRASPTGADGKIYCISEKGNVVVLDTGDEFRILATSAMGEEPVRSSIAVAHGELFIRTAKHLYCIGKP